VAALAADSIASYQPDPVPRITIDFIGNKSAAVNSPGKCGGKLTHPLITNKL
jgi:hypothetical protein